MNLRLRVVTYAVACSADGQPHRRVAEQPGMTQPTLERRPRKWRQTGTGMGQVAIAPADRRLTEPPTTDRLLCLVNPQGYLQGDRRPDANVAAQSPDTWF